jgi:hypothetical protein
LYHSEQSRVWFRSEDPTGLWKDTFTLGGRAGIDFAFLKSEQVEAEKYSGGDTEVQAQ